MKNFFMLDIDLTTAKTEKIEITHLFERYIGGTGVAAALFDQIDPEIDPMSPEAPVIFACGPFRAERPTGKNYRCFW